MVEVEAATEKMWVSGAPGAAEAAEEAEVEAAVEAAEKVTKAIKQLKEQYYDDRMRDTKETLFIGLVMKNNIRG